MLFELSLASLFAWFAVLLRTPPGELLPDGDAASAGEPAAWPSVTVIVPARNEAAMLPRTLPRLLSQDYPGTLRVIVVDERSDDGTADVASGLGAEVVRGQPLPPGWAGKPWGMQQGLRHAGVLEGDGGGGDGDGGPELVLFTDADIAHEPRSLRILVAESEARGLALNARMALLRCESDAERWLIPAFLHFFATLYPMRRVGDPASSVAASAGGCQLLRASVLREMGGVEPIASRGIDDVALGREVKGRGGLLNLACSRGLVRSLREYPGIEDVWRMVRRSAFEELRFSWLRLAGCLLALLLLFAVPLALPYGLVAWCLTAVAYGPAIRHFGLPAWRAFTLPIVGLLYGAMTVDSALRHLRRAGEPWRAHDDFSAAEGARLRR